MTGQSTVCRSVRRMAWQGVRKATIPPVVSRPAQAAGHVILDRSVGVAEHCDASGRAGNTPARRADRVIAKSLHT